MSNDATNSDVVKQGWDQSAPPPRFTLSVHMDGRPESDRLAQVVRRAAGGANGPDLISLVPQGVERWNENATLDCRGTLAALPGAIGCVIGQTLVTLPLRGDLARLHGQIAQADRSSLTSHASGHASGAVDDPAEKMAEIMEDRVEDRVNEKQRLEANRAAGDALLRPESATQTSLLELRSRVARLEGALVGQLTARLDSRLSQLTTREEMEEVAQEVTATMAAVTAMKALIEQQHLDERQRQEEQGAWREEMIEEMRSFRRQVEALLHNNETLKTQVEQRWWQVWQRWKM